MRKHLPTLFKAVDCLRNPRSLALALGVACACVLLTVSVLAVCSHMWGIPPLWGFIVQLLGGLGLTVWFVRRMNWMREPAETRRVFKPVGVLAGGVIVGLLVFGQIWSLRLAMLKKRMKAEGLPVSLADFARDVPKAENAWPAVDRWEEKLGKMMKADEKKSRSYIMSVSRALGDANGRWEIWPDGRDVNKRMAWDAAAGAVFSNVAAQFADYFRMVDRELSPILKRYSKWEGTDFREAAKSLSPSMPRYAGLVNVARVYAVLAEKNALEGNLPAAFGHVSSQVKLASLVSQDPWLIAKMIAVAQAGIAAEAMRAILQNRPEAVVPPELARQVAELRAAVWVPEGFACELANVLDFRGKSPWLSGWGSDPREEMGSLRAALDPLIVRVMWIVGWFDAGIIQVTERFLLPHIRARAWKDVTEEENMLAWYVRRGWASRCVWWSCAFSQLIQKEFEKDTHLQLALAASALNAHRIRTGGYPARLRELTKKELGPGLLADLFGEGDLGYERAGNTYTLFSVGPNGNKGDSKAQALAIRHPLAKK